MEILLINNVGFFIIVATYSICNGLDPKRWQSWLLSAYGLFTFFLCGVSAGNIYKYLGVGAIITSIIMFASVIKFWIHKPITVKLKKPDHDKA